MMDCKKALTEADGDMEKAADILREKGLAAQVKKAGRIAAEGAVYAAVCDKCRVGVVVEINAETDFAAKSDKFQEFIKGVADVIMKKNPADVAALMELEYEDGRTVTQALQDRVLVIGENISIRRFVRFEGDCVAYVHGGGRIGVLVRFEADDAASGTDILKECGKDVAMQIAALNAAYLDKSTVPAEALEKEKEILRAQAINEGKPEKIVDKMVEGRIEKYYKEVCLLEQPFVKDGDKSIKGLMAEVAKATGANLDVVRFERFERGEGIEKRQDNFAEEIAAQMKKA